MNLKKMSVDELVVEIFKTTQREFNKRMEIDEELWLRKDWTDFYFKIMEKSKRMKKKVAYSFSSVNDVKTCRRVIERLHKLLEYGWFVTLDDKGNKISLLKKSRFETSTGTPDNIKMANMWQENRALKKWREKHNK